MPNRGVKWRHYLAIKWDRIKYSLFRLHAQYLMRRPHDAVDCTCVKPRRKIQLVLNGFVSMCVATTTHCDSVSIGHPQCLSAEGSNQYGRWGNWRYRIRCHLADQSDGICIYRIESVCEWWFRADENDLPYSWRMSRPPVDCWLISQHAITGRRRQLCTYEHSIITVTRSPVTRS